MRRSALWFAATSLAVTVVVCASCSPWLALAPLIDKNDNKTNGPAYRSTPTLQGGPSFVALSSGDMDNCVLSSINLAFCWGANRYGSLGTGDTRNYATLVAVSGSHSFRIISTGSNTTCGLLIDNSAYCWGAAQGGALGDGDPASTDQTVPVPVTGGHQFTAISAGTGYVCALAFDGSAWCWGSGALGAGGSLGLDSTQYAPEPVTGGHQFASLSAGPRHACGVTKSGAAYCWGSGFDGELGVGTTPDCGPYCTTPMLVAGNHTWTAITAGLFHSCGIDASANAYCWGDGNAGQLGTGTNDNSLSPQPVTGGLHWSAISAGFNHTCGITVDGLVYCWGTNTFGQLGIGSTSSQSSNVPLAVRSNKFYTAIDGGGDNTCGLVLDGSVYCWGIVLH